MTKNYDMFYARQCVSVLQRTMHDWQRCDAAALRDELIRSTRRKLRIQRECLSLAGPIYHDQLTD